MKNVLILIILLCLGQTSLAQDNPDSTEPETNRPVPVKESTSGEKEPAPVIWPQPFKPSEEIGADSQISFPTDI